MVDPTGGKVIIRRNISDKRSSLSQNDLANNLMGDTSMAEKFGRRIKSCKELHKFAAEFEVGGYLQYRGDKFVKRFVASSYLYITKTICYFNLLNGHNPSDIFKRLNTKVLVLTIK